MRATLSNNLPIGEPITNYIAIYRVHPYLTKLTKNSDYDILIQPKNLGKVVLVMVMPRIHVVPHREFHFYKTTPRWKFLDIHACG